jgi:DNA-binding NarL/FixJ family response regulator
MQGSPGPWSSPALTAAISQAGGLGSLGTALVAADQIRAQVERVRSLTDKPFAVNHTLRPLSEDAYALTLVISPKTVGNHVEHIYGKIGARNRAAAGLFAMQHGLLPEEEFVVVVPT